MREKVINLSLCLNHEWGGRGGWGKSSVKMLQDINNIYRDILRYTEIYHDIPRYTMIYREDVTRWSRVKIASCDNFFEKKDEEDCCPDLHV